jgi:hypothetical protein
MKKPIILGNNNNKTNITSSNATVSSSNVNQFTDEEEKAIENTTSTAPLIVPHMQTRGDTQDIQNSSSLAASTLFPYAPPRIDLEFYQAEIPDFISLRPESSSGKFVFCF